MEQAIFISKTENLKYVNQKYSRLYFGSEFCERLIPSLEDTRTIADFVLKQKMAFTFVTPYVTNQGLSVLRPILHYLIDSLPGSEIVINDWGILRLLRCEFNYSNFALGRLLTKQKRGPRIMNLKNLLPQSAVSHYQASSVDVPILSDFLINNGISRVELDNLLQGVARENANLKASLYYPFAYVTTTRFCVAAYAEEKREFLRDIVSCGKECQKFTFRLRHKSVPVDLFLKGNTQLFINEILPMNLKQLNIDRLVFQPEIPL